MRYQENHAGMDALLAHAREKAGRAYAELILADAKRGCPVKTGHLRRSQCIEQTSDWRTFWIGSNVRYAAYVERGTKRMRARAFLRRALFMRRVRIL